MQTPKNLNIPQGGIGSSLLFAEDSTLGPEPLLWASPKRFGDPANPKVRHSPGPRQGLPFMACAVSHHSLEGIGPRQCSHIIPLGMLHSHRSCCWAGELVC